MLRVISQALLLVIFLAPYALANNNVEECKKQLYGHEQYCKKYYAPQHTVTKYKTVVKTKKPKTYTVTSTDKQVKTITSTKTEVEKFYTTPVVTKTKEVFTTKFQKAYTTKFEYYYKTYYDYSTYYVTKTQTVYDKWGHHPRSLPTPHMLAVRGGSYHPVEKEYDWETIKQACYEIYYPQDKTVVYKKYSYTQPPPKTKTATVTKYYKTTTYVTDFKKETITARPKTIKEYQTSTIEKTRTYTDTQTVEKKTTVTKKKVETKTVTVTTKKPHPTHKKEKHWGRDILEIEAAK